MSRGDFVDWWRKKHNWKGLRRNGNIGSEDRKFFIKYLLKTFATKINVM